MKELHLPWLTAVSVLPLLGAVCVSQLRDGNLARKWAMSFAFVTFLFAVGAWLDFAYIGSTEAAELGHLTKRIFGHDLFLVDRLSAPLLPLVAMLCFLTTLATLRTKIRRFSFSWTLVGEAIVLATFSCKTPWGVIALLALGTLPAYWELYARGKPTRGFVLHMGLFIGLMVLGWAMVEREGVGNPHTLWAVVPLLLAVLIRSGTFPFHCWMTDLFEHATFGTALLFVTPIAGSYAAVRLLLPVAPDDALRVMGHVAIGTSLYAAGMSLVQRDARRFFCFLFLSHSALVLVGLENVVLVEHQTGAPIGVTGALCVWLSVGLAMGGFGLTLRALESRRGRLSLADFQGLYEHTPDLAMCFVLTGLASVGFPGTFGFIGTELLVDGAVEAYPYVGVAVVVAAALNGIAVVQAYFLLFTGRRYASSVSLLVRRRERYAVLALAALILIGGLAPQINVGSRHEAASELLRERAKSLVVPPTTVFLKPTDIENTER